jgi:phage terminase large subunit
MARDWELTLDSARPESISFLRRHGYGRAMPAIKGPGSVKEGIEFLKSFEIIIHTRCTHTIEEFRNYRFEKHPLTGVVLPVLSEKKNHVIDSCRYAVEGVRMPRAGTF